MKWGVSIFFSFRGAHVVFIHQGHKWGTSTAGISFFWLWGPTMANCSPKMAISPIGMKKMSKKKRRCFCLDISRGPHVVSIDQQQCCEDATEPEFWFVALGADCGCDKVQNCHIPHQLPQVNKPKNGSKNHFHAKLVAKMGSPPSNYSRKWFPSKFMAIWKKMVFP